MSSITVYQPIQKAIEKAGRFTSLRLDDSGSVHGLVCVSHRDSTGRLHGNSFWLRYNNESWYIATWGDGSQYMIPCEADVLAMCLECLDSSATPISDVPLAIAAKYGLIRLPE
jgi:hypothetical protein